jgi:hypothetical protein
MAASGAFLAASWRGGLAFTLAAPPRPFAIFARISAFVHI